MKVRIFLRLRRERKKLLLIAAVELLRAWRLVRLKPFSRYADTLGELHHGEHIDIRSPACDALLDDVHWALKKLNKIARGRFTCLMLAIAAKRILSQNGQANTLVLGVRPDQGHGDDPIGAHAWLRAGTRIITGKNERKGHIPVASYHSK